MPSKHTFTIKPIGALIKKYYFDPSRQFWIDPFAGYNSPCKETNDLVPDAPTKHHMQAIDFVKLYKDLDGVLFDPPYSPRQISESYKGAGLKAGMKETQNALLYSSVRNELAPRIKIGGIVISFGWNSGGFGKNRGFEIVEILMVPHGGAHNDTIVVVERKME
jgi:hypothetical protein